MNRVRERSVASAAFRSLRAIGRWAPGTAAILILAGIGVGPRTGAYRTLTVLTGSMRPSIPPGSLVVVVPEPADHVRAGDVITFNAPIADARVVTHRVYQVVSLGPAPIVRTKGDANDAPDPWVAQISGGVVWKVRMVVPHAGRGIVAARNPVLRRASVTLAPAAAALVWLADIWGIGLPWKRRRCATRVPRRAAGAPRSGSLLARATHA